MERGLAGRGDRGTAGDPHGAVCQVAAAGGALAAPHAAKNRTETEQEEQSVKKESVEKCEASAVTVKGLRVLLDAAEAAGYGEAPLVLGGRHLTGLHLRVETLIGAETPGTLVELQATAAEA